MKKIHKFVFVITVVVLLTAVATPVYARGVTTVLMDDEVILGGSYILDEGEIQEGNVLIFGGSADLEVESTVEGDVIIFGGSVDAYGVIEGSLIVFGGSATLGASAIVEGDLIAPGSAVTRTDGSRVEGQIITENTGPPIRIQPLDIPDFPRIPIITTMGGGTSLLWTGVSFLFRTLAMTALAVLVMVFMPKQVERTAKTITAQPVASGGIGLLTYIVVAAITLVMVLMILLIPLALITALVVFLAIVLGWIAMGYEIGRRLEKAFDQEWAAPLSAGVGTFLLTFLVGAIGYIPCINVLVWLLVLVLVMGGVVLSRFGTQVYTGTTENQPVDFEELPAEVEDEENSGEADSVKE